MSRLEAVLLDLEREIAYTASTIRSQRMTSRELAIYYNGLGRQVMSAEWQHKLDDERARFERVERWRKKDARQVRS